MAIVFQPNICDLCNAVDSTAVIHLTSGRAMRSDRTVVAQNLDKVVCDRCGLVRSGDVIPSDSLDELYKEQYTLSTYATEYYFYTPSGPVSRSEIFCDWITASMGKQRWQAGMRCLEVGAGSGMLLAEFSKRFPQVTFEGIELSEAAAKEAQQRGIAVRLAALEELVGEVYDVIYTTAVLEHVASPTTFLRTLRSLLRPGGWLFLCQPTQDVLSYDLFFVDHLHHFGSEHIHQYARKTGFREQGMCVGHAWMPNFSLHIWQAIEVDENPDPFTWYGKPGYTSCKMAAQSLLNDIAQLNSLLAKLAALGRRVAVFGLSEVYSLAYAYTMLGEFTVICGLDDNPNKPEYAKLKFHVIRPEEGTSFNVQDVILTMNTVYYPQVKQRLSELGYNVYAFLSP